MSGLCALCSAFPPRLCDQRGPFVVKVCWRKLAGTEDSPSHPEESTEDRPEQRLQADGSIGALWESATDKFGFEAVNRRRQEWKTQDRLWRKRTQRLGSADGELQMPNVLDERSVSEP